MWRAERKNYEVKNYMNLIRKKVISLFVVAVVLSSTIVCDYSTAYSADLGIELGYTSFQALQSIMLALGVSVGTADGIGHSVAYDDCIRALDGTVIDSNPDATLGKAISEAISSAKNGVVTLGQNVWNTLKSWTKNNVFRQSDNTDVGKMAYDMGYYFNVRVDTLDVDSVMSAYGITLSRGKSFFTSDYVVCWVAEADYLYCFSSDFLDSLFSDIVYVNDKPASGHESYYTYVNSRGVYNGKVIANAPSVLSSTLDILYKYCIWYKGHSVASGLYSDLGFGDTTATNTHTWDGLTDAWTKSKYDVLAPGRERVVDDDNNVVVNGDVPIMIVTDIPADVSIDDVYDYVGVIPVDTSTDKALDDELPESIPAIIETYFPADIPDDTEMGGDSDVDVDTPTVDDVNLLYDLTRIFPFCIPFDLYKSVKSMETSAEAPVFEIPFRMGALEEDVVVNMGDYEKQVKIMRGGLVIFWIIGLILITSKLIKW